MKKVFIGVLVALMLFAFVACDSNSGATLGNTVVTKIEVTSDEPSIFVGETVEKSSLTVVGTYLDGTTFTVPESDFDFAQTSVADIKGKDSGELTDIGSVKYTGFSYGGNNAQLIDSVKGYVYSIDKLDVEGPATPVSYYAAVSGTSAVLRSAYDASAYTVTAQALDENGDVVYEKELTYVAKGNASYVPADKSEYFVSCGTTVSGSSVSGEGELVFGLNGALKTANSSVANVTEKIVLQDDFVNSITVEAKENAEFFAGSAATKYTTAIGTYFEGTAVYASGYEETFVPSSVVFDPAGLSSGNLPAANNSITVTANYGTKQTTCSVPVIADYITSFKASYGNNTVKPGESLHEELITVSDVKFASGASTPSSFVADPVVANPTLPSGLATNGTYTVVVTLGNAEAAKKNPIAYMAVKAGTTTTPVPEK